MIGFSLGLRPRGAGGSPAPTPAVIIVPLLGQSNVVGRNTDDGLDTDQAPIFQLINDGGANNRTLTSDITLLRHPDNLARVGPGINLLKKIAAQNPTALAIIAVPCGMGSTAMASGVNPPWAPSATPGAGGSLFEGAVTATNIAIGLVQTAYPGAPIVIETVMVQGEQDSSNGASRATYYAALSQFIPNWRTRITGVTHGRFVLGSLLPQGWIVGSVNYSAANAAINAAHVDASLNISNVLYSRGPDIRGANDFLHYQPASVARTQGDYIGDQFGDPAAPVMSSPTTYGNETGTQLSFPLTATDTYNHVTFEINGGANAALFELSDPYLSPALRWVGSGTGPAIGTYQVGVRARNGAGKYSATQMLTFTVANEVSPATFFTAGQLGSVWDLTDLSSLSQTIDGNTPVTAAGQPVGRVLDKSGTNNHWTAAADNTTRPTYQVDSNGKPYLQFDGSNDILFANPFVSDANRKFTVIMGLYGGAQASTRVILSQGNPANGAPFEQALLTDGTTTSLTQSYRNDASASIANTPKLTGALDNTARVITSEFYGSGAAMRLRDASARPAGGGDGNWTSAIASTWGGTLSINRASIGGGTNGNPANYFSGRIYSQCEIQGNLTDAQRRMGENWANARCRASALP